MTTEIDIETLRTHYSELFWSNVLRPDPGACWEWQSGCNAYGYGQFMIWKVKKAPEISHRMAWMLTYGPIPPGKCVLHRCDNRRCCNPSHLFLGTRPDNTADMVHKERHARGERAGNVKLAKKQVIEIEQLAIEDTNQREIAIWYSITQPRVSRIKHHRIWVHLWPCKGNRDRHQSLCL